MICESCGAANKDGIDVCTVCGTPLIENDDFENDNLNDTEEPEPKRCKHCGTLNSPTSKYCGDCGKNLEGGEIRKRKKNEVKRKKKNSVEATHRSESQPKKGIRIGMLLEMKTLWLSLSLLLGLILIISIAELFIPHNDSSLSSGRRAVETNLNPAIEAEVVRIASKFNCNCGDCSGESLSICKCNVAVTERNLIRELVERKVDEKEIIKTIDARYGGLKNKL